MAKYSYEFKRKLVEEYLTRKGNCYDNAPTENFFSILKGEIYDGCAYGSRKELKKAIEEFISYYNEDRIKEKLGGLSPRQYREQMKAA